MKFGLIWCIIFFVFFFKIPVRLIADIAKNMPITFSRIKLFPMLEDVFFYFPIRKNPIDIMGPISTNYPKIFEQN